MKKETEIVGNEFSYDAAFSRTLGFVTREEMNLLKKKTVAIAGLGGTGGAHVLTLCRLGIGRMHLADYDRFEIHNFNRQAGANMNTIGHSKIDVMRSQALAINPQLSLQLFPEGVTSDNLVEFFKDVDLYVDALDFFAFDARRLVFAYCHQVGIPVITVAPMGMGAALLNFLPGGMSLEQYFCFARAHSELDLAVHFLVGLTPGLAQLKALVDPSFVTLHNRLGPSTPMACDLCAGVAGTEALKILLDRGKVYSVPHSIHFDAYTNSVYHRWIPWGNANPWQRLKIAMARKRLARI